MSFSNLRLFGDFKGFVDLDTQVPHSRFQLGVAEQQLPVLKLIGGVYLIWLGIKLWRSPAATYENTTVTWDSSGWPLFREGLLTAATNPKGLLFFSALLPQFIDPNRSLLVQFSVIAVTYALTEFATEYVLANAAQRVRPWLARTGRRFNQVCGGLFVAIGVALPLKS